MYCTNCGKEIEDNAVFCGNCGKQLQDGKSKKNIKTLLMEMPIEESVKNIGEAVKKVQENCENALGAAKETATKAWEEIQAKPLEEDMKKNTDAEKTENASSDEATEQEDADTSSLKDSEEDKTHFEFRKAKYFGLWTLRTKIEITDKVLNIEQGKLQKKQTVLRLQDIANISLKRYISLVDLFLGIVIMLIAVGSIAEEGVSVIALLIAVCAAGMLYGDKALLIFDRNNRLLKIIASNEEECERFIQAINCKMDEESISRYNPANFKEPFYQTNLMKLGIVILTLIISVIVAIGLDNSNIDLVKNGSWERYPNATVNEILECGISDVQWSEFTTNSGHNVVEVSGYLNNDAQFIMQFLITGENSFQVSAIRMGGEEYTGDVEMGIVMMALISNYDETYGDGTFDDEIEAQVIDEYTDYLYDAWYW